MFPRECSLERGPYCRFKINLLEFVMPKRIQIINFVLKAVSVIVDEHNMTQKVQFTRI